VKINHLAVAVEDIDAALRLYVDGLRLTVTQIEDIPAEGVRVAFLNTGESHIELVQPLDPENGIARWMAKRNGGGLHHICLETADIAAALAQLTVVGASLINPEPVRKPDGTRYAFIHPKSTGGVLLELYQLPDKTDDHPA
jgi:methylmalonyl-CoA/ethylmalonyl-CoA epimerase